MDRVQQILDEIRGVSSLYGVTSWEKEFLNSIKGAASLSAKQEAVLKRIEEKVFGSD